MVKQRLVGGVPYLVDGWKSPAIVVSHFCCCLLLSLSVVVHHCPSSVVVHCCPLSIVIHRWYLSWYPARGSALCGRRSWRTYSPGFSSSSLPSCFILEVWGLCSVVGSW